MFKRDATAPVVTVTGVSNGVSYTLGNVPTAGCSSSDALAGIATQATVNVTGGNPDGTGSFTATCNGASDNADNSSSASVSYTVTGAADACTTTVTLNAANQSFFNAKGGKIGLWTVAALNAFVDDFGGGAVTSVTAATLDAPISDELVDDGAEITVVENFPTGDTATAPDGGMFANWAFLPLVNR